MIIEGYLENAAGFVVGQVGTYETAQFMGQREENTTQALTAVCLKTKNGIYRQNVMKE